MTGDPFLMGVFFGFVPAMGFLYVMLHEYQTLFAEKRVFRLFFVGMIVGILLTLLQQFISPRVVGLVQFAGWSGQVGAQLLLFALLLGVLEALAFAAILNMRAFRLRRDTPFYGVAFGLGFGGTTVLVLIAFILRAQQRLAPQGSTWVETALLVMLGVFLIGGILVHATMGAWIGQGAATGSIFPMVGRAATLRGAYVALFYAMLTAPDPRLGHALAIAGIVLGVALAGGVVFPQLDRIVPLEVLREIGVHNRRLYRRIMRQHERDGPR